SAFVVDGLFQGASFCKYLCPIGQFNFVQSLASPLEVKAVEPGVCATCRTRDCLRGRGEVPGCELGLFLPRKAGNMDCTFCLDCVHACPHENVGILPVIPGKVLWEASSTAASASPCGEGLALGSRDRTPPGPPLERGGGRGIGPGGLSAPLLSKGGLG